MSKKKKKKIDIEYPRHWWFSCDKFTCYVATDKGNVIMKESAPIVRRFVGQHISRLTYWMKNIGGFMWAEYDKNGKEF